MSLATFLPCASLFFSLKWHAVPSVSDSADSQVLWVANCHPSHSNAHTQIQRWNKERGKNDEKESWNDGGKIFLLDYISFLILDQKNNSKDVYKYTIHSRTCPKSSSFLSLYIYFSPATAVWQKWLQINNLLPREHQTESRLQLQLVESKHRSR